MLTLYARREPTTDPATRELNAMCPGTFRGKHDVVIYKDAAASQFYGRHPWHYRRLDRRNRWITLNCYRWRLEWLPDMAGES